MRNTVLAIVALCLFTLNLSAQRVRPMRHTGPQEVTVGEEVTVTLPYLNSLEAGATWATTLVLTNVSSGPVEIPNFYAPWPVGSVTIVVPAHSSFHWDRWPREGTGFQNLSIPLEIVASVDVTNTAGRVYTIGPVGPVLTPGVSAQWHGLKTTPPFESLLMLGSGGVGASAVSIQLFDGETSVGILYDWVLSDEVIFKRLPVGVNRIVVRHGGIVSPVAMSPFYATVFTYQTDTQSFVATAPAER